MPRRSLIQGFATHDHDHDVCVGDALMLAESVCAGRVERLTPLRRKVLELVWDSHQPVKAYDLLDMLSGERKRAAPPTVYRALDFLRDAGLVHKIESLNAFIGCAKPDRRHSAQFLICIDCGAIAEMDDASLTAAIARNAKQLGFAVQQETIEVEGRCRACRSGSE